MRRLPALIALLLIPIAACGSSATTPGAEPTSAASAVSSNLTPMTNVTEMSISTPASTTSTAQPAAPKSTPLPSSADPMSPSVGSAAAESPTTEVAPGVTITTADSAYGRILFDGSGQAIYLFDK